nr:MAG TPA: hypothetical protein [Bacteriophage sp.]
MFSYLNSFPRVYARGVAVCLVLIFKNINVALVFMSLYYHGGASLSIVFPIPILI